MKPCMRCPPKNRLQLIVGAEFRCSDGLQLVLLAPEQRAYAQICQLITPGAAARQQGSRIELPRADLETGSMTAWRCGSRRGRCADGSRCAGANRSRTGQRLRELSAVARWLAVELHRAAGDGARLARCLRARGACGLPAVAAGDVHMHRARRRAIAGSC